MSNPREAQFLKLTRDFPASPMGHFSLGKLYLEEGRYAEAVGALEQATRLDATYAAALVSLGEAHALAGQPEQAKDAYARAKACALAQNHPGLAEEIDDRVAEL
jgi:tetratricopeptide (TPR) repeat protein